jgi:hypothetical protein
MPQTSRLPQKTGINFPITSGLCVHPWIWFVNFLRVFNPCHPHTNNEFFVNLLSTSLLQQVDFKHDEQWHEWMKDWLAFLCEEKGGRPVEYPTTSMDVDHQHHYNGRVIDSARTELPAFARPAHPAGIGGYAAVSPNKRNCAFE